MTNLALWRTSRPLALSIVAWLLLAACAVRHNWFWGGAWKELLKRAEGAGLILFAALAGCAWIAAVRRADSMSKRQLFVGGAALTILAATIPAFLSSDAFDYVARGRVESVHGANPYIAPPAAFADRDPALQQAGWPDHVMPYGPLMAVLQWLVSAVCSEHVALGAWLFKALFAACHAATAAVIYATVVHRHGETLARHITVAWLWNPYLLLESANSGHNEALLALLLAIVAWGLTRDRFLWATTAFGAAVLTKHGCAVLGPLLLALAVAKRRVGPFSGGVGISALITLPLAWHYFSEPGSLAFIAKQTTIQRASLQRAAQVWLSADAATAVRVMGVVAVCAAMAWAIVGLRRSTSFANRGAWVTLVLVILLMPQFLPWYHMWWLPLMGLWTSPRLWSITIALTFTAPASYAIWASTRKLDGTHQVVQWTLALGIPLLAAIIPFSPLGGRLAPAAAGSTQDAAARTRPAP